MNLKQISEQINTAEARLQELYNEIVSKGTVDFVEKNCEFTDPNSETLSEDLHENDEWDVLPKVEIRSSFTGEVSDWYVLQVCKDGIYARAEHGDGVDFQQFKYLAGIEQQLMLLQEMEAPKK